MTHTRACATTQGVSHLETLQAVAVLSLLADDIKNSVNELGALGVVTLGPVVASARLRERGNALDERIYCEAVAYTCSTEKKTNTPILIISEATSADCKLAKAVGSCGVHTCPWT